MSGRKPKRLRDEKPRTDYFLRMRWFVVFAVLLEVGLLLAVTRTYGPVMEEEFGHFLATAFLVAFAASLGLFAVLQVMRRRRASLPGRPTDPRGWRPIRRRRPLDPPGVFVRLRRALWQLAVVGTFAAMVLAVIGGGAAQWTFLASMASFAVALAMSLQGPSTATLTFVDPPLRVGAPARMHFHFEAARRHAFDRATFTLLCVVESPRLFGLVRPYVDVVRAIRIEKGDDLPPGTFDVDLAFDIPPDAPPSDLLARPAVYWELAVRGEGPWLGYSNVFLVPVAAG
jgi:hypothetical protein